MSSVWHLSHIDLTIRLLLAMIFGGLVGLEREWHNHAAGLRTHILVCLGSTAIMLLSIYGFSSFMDELNVRADPARLAAQVISGIGFLGAGTIMRTGLTVSGLTTAASIWVVAAIGLCIGAGFYYGAALTTCLALLSLFVLNKWERVLLRSRKTREVVILAEDKPGALGSIASAFGDLGMEIVHIKINAEKSSATTGSMEPVVSLYFSLKQGSEEEWIAALERISRLSPVISTDSKLPSGDGRARGPHTL
ncbi:MgtC/SapB family protein [Paenibacillus puerhi]|uniref:MgtC/SapB family protein n=1 Tax=Paenibacillus puerhi TaxID=2692622 RepID=UPI0013593BF5|nr:MgtC/SapB family protein [Paenibacillus puerhi]